MSNLPTYPAPQTVGTTPAAPRPTILNAAFWLYLAAIVVGLISTFVSIPIVAASTAALQQRVPHAAAAGNLGGAVIAIAVVGGLIGAAIWVLFLVFLRRGHGWARWVLGALTVLGLLSVASAYGLGALHEVLAVIAAILTFLPASTAYFRDTAARRKLT